MHQTQIQTKKTHVLVTSLCCTLSRPCGCRACTRSHTIPRERVRERELQPQKSRSSNWRHEGSRTLCESRVGVYTITFAQAQARADWLLFFFYFLCRESNYRRLIIYIELLLIRINSLEFMRLFFTSKRYIFFSFIRALGHMMYGYIDHGTASLTLLSTLLDGKYLWACNDDGWS